MLHPELTPQGRPGRRTGERVFWTALAVVTTAVLLVFREETAGAHIALIYLMIVLGASARGGRRLGLVLALVCFFAFNFFFIPPYHTLWIHRPLDWLVLLVFLVTSAVATQLLHRAQSEATAAGRRAAEIERLALLGAESLNAGRAEDAVAAIARVIQSGLGISACEIYVHEDDSDQVRRVACAAGADAGADTVAAPDRRSLARAAAGLVVAERADGTDAVARETAGQPAMDLLLTADARAILIPLRTRDRTVGVLRLVSADGIALDVSQRRFAEALAYYAALGLERVRLTAVAERADALREADRLKDGLLASISHDLRTPLTTIKALAHDIAADGDDRAMVIQEEADRLNRFVSDLLDLSRLNAGAPPLARELIAVEDVLGAALQQVSGTLDGRTIHAALDPAEPLLVGRFDFVHTLRALVNLIDNALKYSPQSAAVDVSVRREGDYVAFAVSDRGAGVPAEERERIFMPFHRGDGSHHTGGTGLGLAIARRSAELQGGDLAYSPRPGGGSVFTLRLPAVTVAEMGAMSS
ncbi:MAG: ATP-binding protein [Gemmatimonadota bacterium]